jgi:hypothetical protein
MIFEIIKIENVNVAIKDYFHRKLIDEQRGKFHGNCK